MVHGDHAAGLDDAVVGGQVLFGEGGVVSGRGGGFGEGLAHELGGPVGLVVFGAAAAGGDAGDDEGHCCRLGEGLERVRWLSE